MERCGDVMRKVRTLESLTPSKLERPIDVRSHSP